VEATAKKTILRIELWHGALLLVLLAALGPQRFVDPVALLAGGLFMGVNFILLSLGIAWVLMPFAGKGRVKAGVGLLALKIIIFLALLSALFFKFSLDALSFSLGFSTLILAIVIEAVRVKLKAEDT
jgi:hypothetical protein